MSMEVAVSQTFDQEMIDLIKQTVAKGVSDLELQMFLHHCERTGLDPLMEQVYAIKRWDAKLQRDVMKIQTGIAGLRLIADRTKHYAPGQRTVFTLNEDGGLFSAIAAVKKLTEDGTWHIVEGEAFYEEYAQRTKAGEITLMWQKGRTMLAKCAEALAIKKAFPAETSGLYTHEEMMQADSGRKPLRTGAEMLKELEAKDAPAETGSQDGAGPLRIDDETSSQQASDAAPPHKTFGQILDLIDANPDWCLQKAEWKRQKKIKYLDKATPETQQHFLAFMRETMEGFPY